MSNITSLYTLAPFNHKILFSKPLIYIIQFFTWNKREHAALLVDDIVINMSGKGWEEIPYENWLEEYKTNGVKVEQVSLLACNKDQIERIKAFSKSKVGKVNYAVAGSVWSLLDNSKLEELDIKFKGSICSLAVRDCLVAGGILPRIINIPTPAELRKEQKKSGLFGCGRFV